MKPDPRKGTFPPPCEVHAWQPVSFRFEHEMFDLKGRVQIRQPDPECGRVYVVCMKCHRHTYIETLFAGYFLACPEDHTALDPRAAARARIDRDDEGDCATEQFPKEP